MLAIEEQRAKSKTVDVCSQSHIITPSNDIVESVADSA